MVGGRWILICLLVILTAFGLVYAWSNLSMRRIEYQQARLIDERRQLLDVSRRLELAMSTLSSHGRLLRLARERLGLMAPALEQVVDLP